MKATIMPSHEIRFVGGPLDGAFDTCDIEEETNERQIGLPLNGHNYTLDLDTNVAKYTPEFDDATKCAEFGEWTSPTPNGVQQLPGPD